MINPQQSLRNGLIAAWCPALGDSGYLLRDRSGFNRNATLTGMGGQVAWSATPKGRAIQFDGSNDYTDATMRTGLSGDFTFACWAKPEAISGFHAMMVSHVTSGYTNFYIFFSINSSGRVVCQLFNGVQNPDIGGASSFTVSTGQWIHAVLTRTDKSMRIVVNGVERATGTDTTTTVPTYTNFFLGGQPGFSRWFNGQMADARVWSRALSDAGIQRLYEGGPGFGLVPQRQRRLRKIGNQWWINVGGTWKKADAYLNVGGTWKKPDGKINVGGTWK
jgi:hypothetical protein